MKLTKKKTYMDDYAVQHCLYAKKTHGNPDMHMHNAHAQGGTVDRKRWLHRFILHSARRATGQDDLVDNAYSTIRTSHILRHRDLCDTVLPTLARC